MKTARRLEYNYAKNKFSYLHGLVYFDVVSHFTLIIRSSIQQSTMNWNFKTLFQKSGQVMFQNRDMHAFQTHLEGRQEAMQPLLNSNPLTLQD